MAGDEDLITLFKRAAEIASAVPEAMREAAFHRALDALQETSTPPSVRSRSQRVRNRPTSDVHAKNDPVQLLNQLERSRAQDVDGESGALAKSLALLRVAERELGIERLTSAQIAKVFTDKFRWRVTRQGVGQALDEAGRFVDRRKEGRSVTYRLMEPGEQWLDRPAEERKTLGGRKSPSGGNKRRTPSKAKAVSKKARSSSKPEAKTRATTSRAPGGRVGPKQAIEALLAAGYFSSPRTLAAMRESLQHDRALRFKPSDLSPALTRLLREGRLVRSKNVDGQYEYLASGA